MVVRIAERAAQAAQAGRRVAVAEAEEAERLRGALVALVESDRRECGRYEIRSY